MKKVLILFFLFTVAVFFNTGCNPNPGTYDAGFDQLIDDEILSAYNKLGKVTKVFKAHSSARFYTGQIIENIFGYDEVKFYGSLIEYDSLSSDILDYVEKLPESNALMHQSYDNVTYAADKRYVEFSTYTDFKTNEIIAHEVRIFSGDFMDTYNTNFWYAKSILFDPTLEIDMSKGVYVKTGEVCPGILLPGYDEQKSYKAILNYPEIFDYFGDVTSVYVTTNTEGEVLKSEMNDRQYYIIYYAEYSDLKPEVKAFYENRKDEKKGWFPDNSIYMAKDRYYISYQKIAYNIDDKVERGQIVIFNGADYAKLRGGAISSEFYINNSEKDLYDTICKMSESTYREVQNYPSVLTKFGQLSNVYAYAMDNGEIVNDAERIDGLKKKWIAEYDYFYDQINAKYEEMGNFYDPEDNFGRYKEGKKYIEYFEYYEIQENQPQIIFEGANFYTEEVDIIRGIRNYNYYGYEDFYDFVMNQPKE